MSNTDFQFYKYAYLVHTHLHRVFLLNCGYVAELFRQIVGTVFAHAIAQLIGDPYREGSVIHSCQG